MLYLVFLALESAVSQSLKNTFTTSLFDARLIYPCKVLSVALLLLVFRGCYEELAKFSMQLRDVLWSVGVGGGVFLLWINLDHGWMSLGQSTGYDPRNLSGAIDWSLALPRLMGATLVVPIMEELFWHSFMMRWIDYPEFLKVSPVRIGLRALLISSVMFGLGHNLWLAGIIAGLAYGWLYVKSQSLWTPVLAHVTTNGLLGLWVLQTGQWSFW